MNLRYFCRSIGNKIQLMRLCGEENEKRGKSVCFEDINIHLDFYL